MNRPATRYRMHSVHRKSITDYRRFAGLHCTPFRWSTSPFPTETHKLVSTQNPKSSSERWRNLYSRKGGADKSETVSSVHSFLPHVQDLPSRTCGPEMKNPSWGRGKYRCLITGVNAPKPSHLPKFDRPEDLTGIGIGPQRGRSKAVMTCWRSRQHSALNWG